MPDFRMLNGNPKATVIETFDNRAVVICGGKRLEFPSLDECKRHILENGLEVNVQFLFGSSIKREIQKAKEGDAPWRSS